MIHKCSICSQPIQDKNEEMPFKNRYAHKTCFNVYMSASVKPKETAKKVKNRKPKAEMKNEVSEEEYKEKMQYYDYLKQQLCNPNLPAKIYKVTEDYIDKYNFSYVGMYHTLLYIVNIGKAFTDNIVGLIPYYYADAVKLFEGYEQALNTYIDYDVDESYKSRVVKIRPPCYKPDLIDIDGIGETNT